MVKHRKINPDEVRRLAQEGHRTAEIARELGISVSSVVKARSRLGIRAPKQPRPWTYRELKQLEQLVEAGVPQAEIGRRLGRSRGAVNMACGTHGIRGHPYLDNSSRVLLAADLSRKGLTQTQIARQMGVRQTTVSRYLKRAKEMGEA